MTARSVIGWDIGGAHLKAALLERGELLDAAQWPCPLWQGLGQLESALAAARTRWPDRDEHAQAVTMTGELVDAFAHREDGVRRIAALIAATLPAPQFFAGAGTWRSAGEVGAAWREIASANWLATALHTAQVLGERTGVLVDIGSTTTDLVPFRRGEVLALGRNDAERLARCELVYQGVVRTPLCALAQRIAWGGREFNVMNEFFATTADVYRLTGELDPEFDQQVSADGANKDAAGSRVRLARMIGMDARDAGESQWLDFARAWRERQLALLREQLGRVCAAHGLHAPGLLVSTGCGDFLATDLTPAGWSVSTYAQCVAGIRDAASVPRAQVCASAVAVAALFAREND